MAVGAGAGGAALYWLVHGSADWFWEFAGLGGPAFALLGVLSAAALSWVARRCAAEAPGSERRARRAMTVVYALLVALGALFLAAALRGESADFKSAVQAALFVALGAGGLAVNLRPRRARRSGGDRA